MDLLLPPWLTVARLSVRYVDSTGVSRGEFTGKAVTGGKGGDRLAASLEFAPKSNRTAELAVERAALISFLARLRGRQNRAYLYNPAQRLRGSFPATELITNGTFETGTTGWAAGFGASIAVTDRVLRVTRINNAAPGTAFVQAPTPAAFVQWAPYAWRVMIQNIRGAVSAGATFGGAVTGGSFDVGATPALRTSQFIATATSGISLYADNTGALVSIAGDFYEVLYGSCSRCALVDNGPNALLQSDAFNTTWTTAPDNTVVASSNVAPDGTVTADAIRESNTNNAEHYVRQPVTVGSSTNDFTFSCTVLALSRTWCVVRMIELTGSTVAYAFVNLSTGAIGTVAAGANWSNPRAHVVSYGAGWYRCTITARKTNAATSIACLVSSAIADNAFTYVGAAATDAVTLWRGSMTLSSVPVLGAQTTTIAVPSGTAQTGSALNVKGLPASTNGLLLPNDEIEVITSRGSELKIVTAALNSDAAGLGYLQFEPPLLGVPSDNAPIIVHQPMGRFLFNGDMVGWDHEPGVITRSSAEFEEA